MLADPRNGKPYATATGAHADAEQPTRPDRVARKTAVDQALLAQLQTLLAKNEIATTGGTPPPMQTGSGAKDGDATLLPANIVAEITVKTPPAPTDAGHPARQMFPAGAAGLSGTDKAPGKDKSTDLKDVGEQLKALAGAADTAKQQAAPAQTTIAKALPLHIDTPTANNSNGQQSGSGSHPQQQQSHTSPNAPATTSDSAKPTEIVQPMQPAAPQQPAHAPVQAAAAAPGDAAAPVQAAQTATPHPVSASLHITQQTETAPQPNLGSIAVNIATKTKNGDKHFDIRLDPPELGRIEVKLTIDDAGKAQANLAAEKPHTLELLQRDRAMLERALRDAGLDLAGGGLNFSLKGQDRESGDSPRGRAFSASAVTQTDTSTPILGLSHTLPADSRLDIRV